MKLKHVVVIGLAILGGFMVIHWAFSHGGMAKVNSAVGLNGTKAYAGAGLGGNR